jgi:hypothetical protein
VDNPNQGVKVDIEPTIKKMFGDDRYEIAALRSYIDQLSQQIAERDRTIAMISGKLDAIIKKEKASDEIKAE